MDHSTSKNMTTISYGARMIPSLSLLSHLSGAQSTAFVNCSRNESGNRQLWASNTTVLKVLVFRILIANHCIRKNHGVSSFRLQKLVEESLDWKLQWSSLSCQSRFHITSLLRILYAVLSSIASMICLLRATSLCHTGSRSCSRKQTAKHYENAHCCLTRRPPWKFCQKNTILKLSKTSCSLVPSSRLQLRRHLFCVRGVGPMCTLATVARLVVPMLHVKQNPSTVGFAFTAPYVDFLRRLGFSSLNLPPT